MTEQEVRMSQRSGNSGRVPGRREDSEADSGRLSPLAAADVDLLMDVDALSITEDSQNMPPPRNLLTLAELASHHERLDDKLPSTSGGKRKAHVNSETFTVERHDANLLVRIGGEGKHIPEAIADMILNELTEKG